MAELVLNADTGRELGSSSSRRLRRENRVPGVVYGLESEPVSVAVDYGELRQVLTTDAGVDAVIDAVVGVARSGEVGDGKMFVTSVERAVRIRTGETDDEAI